MPTRTIKPPASPLAMLMVLVGIWFVGTVVGQDTGHSLWRALRQPGKTPDPEMQMGVLACMFVTCVLSYLFHRRRRRLAAYLLAMLVAFCLGFGAPLAGLGWAILRDGYHPLPIRTPASNAGHAICVPPRLMRRADSVPYIFPRFVSSCRRGEVYWMTRHDSAGISPAPGASSATLAKSGVRTVHNSMSVWTESREVQDGEREQHIHHQGDNGPLFAPVQQRA